MLGKQLNLFNQLFGLISCEVLKSGAQTLKHWSPNKVLSTHLYYRQVDLLTSKNQMPYQFNYCYIEKSDEDLVVTKEHITMININI